MIRILQRACRDGNVDSVFARSRISSALGPRLPLLAIPILAFATAARAEEASGARDGLKAISPFLEDQTILVAHVDLSRIDVGAALQQAADIANLPEPQRAAMAQAQPIVQGLITALQNAGTTELYAAASVQEFLQRGPPYVLAPVKKGGDHRAVAGILFSGNPGGPASREELGKQRHGGPFSICEKVGDVVFCGSKETLERLQRSKPVLRPEFADALAAVGDVTARLAFAPSRDHRRVLTDMLPQLPEELGGGSGKAFADGLQWATLGVQPPPNLVASLIIQSKDAESAAQLERFLVAAGRLANQRIPARDKPPKFAEFVELLTPRAQGNRLTLTINEENQSIFKLKSLLTTVVREASKPAKRSQCANNLKQLAIAMHNFHDRYRSLPPSASYDDKGKKLLSWRVFVLPFVEQSALYRQFRLDEPWDSEHNKKLIPKMPAVFACPAANLRAKGMTTYLAPLAEKTVFSGKAGVPFKDITDGMSNTIMLVEVDADRAVIWTKPDDLAIDFDNPLDGLGSAHEDGFNAAFCDGSVRWIVKAIDPDTLRLLLMRNDGKSVEDF